MQQIAASEYAAVAPLFAGLEIHLAVRAVLDGAAVGQVFADARVGMALLWVQHRVFIGGPNPHASQDAAALLHRIAQQARDRGDYGFGVYYPEPWQATVAELAAGLTTFPVPRQYWQLDLTAEPASGDPQMPPGYALRRVDAALAADEHLGNRQQLLEEMCSERPSVAEFLARSFGVCVAKDNSLAGWCLSEYNCGDSCEVGIETVEAHRRLGLGRAMALALCADAGRHGLRQVGWHCMARNAASGATARSAGFCLAREYPSLVVELHI